jgi:hypothetical protein
MEAVGFFPRIFPAFPIGSNRKESGKIRQIPSWNTASMKSQESAGTARFLAGLFDLATQGKVSAD